MHQAESCQARYPRKFVGSAGDAFSAICFLQKSRFTSSKPSISAIASDKKCIRHRTNSFVRYCLKIKTMLVPYDEGENSDVNYDIDSSRSSIFLDIVEN